jgi:hypothetical protein
LAAGNTNGELCAAVLWMAMFGSERANEEEVEEVEEVEGEDEVGG